MTMSAFLLVVVVISSVSAQNFLYLSLNDVCKNAPDVWRCRSLGDCPTLKEAIRKGQRPDVCSFQGREPIICCPSTNQNEPTPTKETSTITRRTTTTTRRTTTTTRRTTTTTRPTSTTMMASKSTYWWATKPIYQTEEGPVWGSSWTTTSSITPTTKKPAISHKSKAQEKCEEYSKYVYRIEQSPTLLAGQKPENITINECNIQTLIVGGIDAKPKEFPHMALIGYGNKPRIEWLCGGSLISPKFVLSAAHCTQPTSRVAQWVKLGDLDTAIDTDDAKPVVLKIIKRTNHHQYSNQNLYHDIALYELESEVKLNSYIRPLCLHTDKDIGHNTALASGWGHTSWGGRGSTMLQKVNISLVSNRNCNKEFGRGEYKQQLPNGIVDDLMVCAGGEVGKDTCQGDSGGPLQIEHKDIYCMYSQIGIVSFGKGCALSYPGVYTRVSNYLPWIESIVWP